MTSGSFPKIAVVATGGSIAGVGPDRLDYILYPELGEHLTIDQSLGRIPEANDIAEIQAEDMVSVGSTAIGVPDWLKLARRINELLSGDTFGVVVTHGTATLEETAYFLHLTVRSKKPVVVTGAMRPPSSLGTDADVNLIDAIRVAAASHSAGRGVLTILNNQIQAARDVTKTNSFRVETFQSIDFGFLGYADSDKEVVFYRTPDRAHTNNTEFDIDNVERMPRVDVPFAYAGADGTVIRALVEAGVNGLVAAGLGSGGSPPLFMEALKEVSDSGLPVVIATHTGSGRVMLTRRFTETGYIVADNLAPKKARILLMLALTVTSDKSDIQRMMLTY